MSNVFFTSDLHLGHANIVKYCNRPQLKAGDLDTYNNWAHKDIKFQRADEMNEFLIRNWNARIMPSDTAHLVGDFCCYGNERGESGSRTKAEEWLSRLNGTKVIYLGNHDSNNTVKRGLDSGVLSAGGERIWICHRPEDVPYSAGITAAIVGHVHTAWKTKMRPPPDPTGPIMAIPMINVGVDTNNYYPVKLDEVLGLIQKTRKNYANV